MTRQTILLTGATGFIGRELGKQLARAGHVIHAVCRNPAAARSQLPYPCQVFGYDADGLRVPDEALAGVDVVIHLAGEPIADKRWTEAQKRRIIASRTKSTATLCEQIAALARPPEAFLQASAIGFYGDSGESLVDEQDRPGSGFLADVTRAWEEASGSLADLPIRRALFRFGMVLGLSGGALPRLIDLYADGLGAILGSGRQWMSWIHVDDAVGMLLRALTEKAWTGPVNAVAPHPVTNATFHAAMTRVMQLAPSRGAVPQAVLRVALGERAALLLASNQVSAAKATTLGYVFRFPLLEEALKDLLGDGVVAGAHRLYRQIWLPRPVAEVWPFFCDEANLEVITPPWLGFRVLGKTTPSIGEGTRINYKIKLRGLSLDWESLISTWRPGEMFVDEQTRGPYATWHHTHRFEPLADGTLMTDAVQYRLPLQRVTGLIGGQLVASDLKKIFAYRQDFVSARFNASK